MDEKQIKALLEAVHTGGLSVDQAIERLRRLPFEDLGFVRLDHHRHLRQGFPEVVFGQGKTVGQLVSIAKSQKAAEATLLVTRIAADVAREVIEQCADPNLSYAPTARCLWREHGPRRIRGRGTIAVVCAGTSDTPVAEEAALTAELMGNEVSRIYDVGVAGLHRLFAQADVLLTARVLVVVAGMEGALPSVVGGLVSRPVIAVPTSIGYGASFHGLTALLAMLNSCAAGVSVVNIDNGFGAGYAAALINRADAPEVDG